MATPASTEASEIRRRGRRRLIGAIALVILAVVFVPMIFDSEPRPRRSDAALEIPAKDTAPPLPAPAPVTPAVTPAKAGAQTPTPGPAVVEKATSPAGPKGPAADVVPAKAGTRQPIAQAAPELEGFAVQVGAFRDEDKLKQAREKLAAAKIPHFVERRGDLNRLRAGPYPSREAAEKALAAVKAASLDGQVVPLP